MSCGKICIKITYIYKDVSKKDQVVACMDKNFAYCKQSGVQGTSLTSMRATAHADGKGYDIIEVYSDAAGAEAYFRVMEADPNAGETETVLGTLIDMTVCDIIATKEERDKAPTIAMYYPEGQGPTKYVEREPTADDTKAPHFGWA